LPNNSKIKTISNGYENLAIAIIAAAAHDLASNNLDYRKSAWRFFTQKKDNILIDFFGLNTDKLLQDITPYNILNIMKGQTPHNTRRKAK